MTSSGRRHPSAALIVAMVALIVAVSGTAMAATRLISGDKLIARHSLSGSRLRRHTLTGTQIKVNALGTVPRARLADLATTAKTAATATRATSAQTAMTATTAANAASLGGQPPSSYLAQSNQIGTHGIIKATASAGPGTETHLFDVGPFSVTMRCSTYTGTGNGTPPPISTGTRAEIDVSSSEADSVVNGAQQPNPDIGLPTASMTAPDASAGGSTVQLSLQAPSGQQAFLTGAIGVKELGADCWASFAGLR